MGVQPPHGMTTTSRPLFCPPDAVFTANKFLIGPPPSSQRDGFTATLSYVTVTAAPQRSSSLLLHPLSSSLSLVLLLSLLSLCVSLCVCDGGSSTLLLAPGSLSFILPFPDLVIESSIPLCVSVSLARSVASLFFTPFRSLSFISCSLPHRVLCSLTSRPLPTRSSNSRRSSQIRQGSGETRGQDLQGFYFLVLLVNIF